MSPSGVESGVAPVATLTMKKWEPKHDPLADLYAPAANDKRRIARPLGGLSSCQ